MNTPPLESKPPESSNESTEDKFSESRLRSIHSSTFVDILRHFGVSLAVTTYQAGFLIILRADGELNTHFRSFSRPMGMAVSPLRMALGTAREVIDFQNMAALAQKLEPFGKHQACYLPRSIQITGDIDIHEMAFAGEPLNEEVWIANTKFSCLCTLNDRSVSFVPRWRPKFVSGYAAEDRCHLNGLAIVDKRPKYVTAFGESDTAEGWRENKKNGGIIIDVDSDEVICRGLSMPHSPRWYDNQLWVLESGNGSIGTVDLDTGRYQAIQTFEGFTRGLTFCGQYAFVGLSQVRETAVFSDISIGQSVDERICGVAVIDIISGEKVGFVHFQDAVQEIFAIDLLPFPFPEVLELSDDRVGDSYALPDDALAEVSPPTTHPARE